MEEAEAKELAMAEAKEEAETDIANDGELLAAAAQVDAYMAPAAWSADAVDGDLEDAHTPNPEDEFGKNLKIRTCQVGKLMEEWCGIVHHLSTCLYITWSKIIHVIF